MRTPTELFKATETCWRCKNDTLAPLRNANNEIVGNRISALPIAQATGPMIGGPSFLAGYKMCSSCGLNITVNLTFAGLDPT